ncbi:MAG: hypothetical protein M1833_000184 [Piccolia ochrophora]|nr:MAG: hypothetical protein M1833_000184 [Piccolia ochrophora]
MQSGAEVAVPLILDESYDSHETAAIHYGANYDEDLFAEAGLARLSMSGDGKQYQHALQGFMTTRPYTEPTYGFAQPGFPPQPLFTAVGESQNQNSEDQPTSAQTPYSARATYSPQQRSLIDARGQPLPGIQSCTPVEGSSGTKVFVQIYSTYDLMLRASLSLTLVFGSNPCACTISPLSSREQYFRYLLVAHAPSFTLVGAESAEVPIRLRLEDGSGQLLGLLDVGTFTYSNVVGQQSYTSPQLSGRKRKSSADSARVPAKRFSNQHLRTASGDEVPDFSYTPSTNSPYSEYIQPVMSSEPYRISAGYEPSRTQSSYPPQPVSRQMPQRYSNSPTVAHQPLKVSSQPITWSPSSPNINHHQTQSPLTSATSDPIKSNFHNQSASGSTNPRLVRTSMQHPPSQASSPAVTSQAGQLFNPYIYPQKAILKMQGDLDLMGENWQADEWDAKRRIVQFQRQQTGSTIHTTFGPVTPDGRPPPGICISCIWWAEKKECYVTSVDTIYLLESLVAVRFTVEEKNRIRRNLEGFRPLTVSKGKQDSEEFFKIIMGFPAPKPRNIEKDVKVFPWKILAHALKKIIGKYSASYASTAGALPTPVSSSGYMSGSSGAGTLADASPEYQNMPSPRSAPDSIGSGVYHPTMTSTSLSPGGKHARSLQTSIAPPELRLAVPHVSEQNLAPNQWPRQPNLSTHVDQSQQYHGGPHAGRASWDFNAYLDTSPAASARSQVLHYGPGPGIIANHDTHQSSLGNGHPTSRA